MIGASTSAFSVPLIINFAGGAAAGRHAWGVAGGTITAAMRRD